MRPERCAKCGLSGVEHSPLRALSVCWKALNPGVAGQSPASLIPSKFRLTKGRESPPRLLAAELGMPGWRDEGTPLKQLGNVEDVSPNGMGVLVREDHPVGTPVTISYEEKEELAGVVRHYSERAEGYFLGIEFKGGSKDSVLHFYPALLVPLV